MNVSGTDGTLLGVDDGKSLEALNELAGLDDSTCMLVDSSPEGVGNAVGNAVGDSEGASEGATDNTGLAVG